MSLSTYYHRLWLAIKLHHRQRRCRPCGHFEVVVAIVVAAACACTHRAQTVISSHYGQRGLALSRGRGDLGREVLAVTEKRKIGFVVHIRYAGGKRNEDAIGPLSGSRVEQSCAQNKIWWCTSGRHVNGNRAGVIKGHTAFEQHRKKRKEEFRISTGMG